MLCELFFPYSSAEKAKCSEFERELDDKSNTELADLLVAEIYPLLGSYSMESAILFNAAWRLKGKDND